MDADTHVSIYSSSTREEITSDTEPETDADAELILASGRVMPYRKNDRPHRRKRERRAIVLGGDGATRSTNRASNWILRGLLALAVGYIVVFSFMRQDVKGCVNATKDVEVARRVESILKEWNPTTVSIAACLGTCVAMLCVDFCCVGHRSRYCGDRKRGAVQVGECSVEKAVTDKLRGLAGGSGK